MAYRSIATVRADVARRWFQSEGDGIVWAVVDSGIDAGHRHFARFRNLDVPPPLEHRDFTATTGDGYPLTDEFGHGTHVAGTIAGETLAGDGPIVALEHVMDAQEGRPEFHPKQLTGISGMAPKTKLLSVKVIGEDGTGPVSNVIAALDYIQQLNQFGRRLLVHGVNLSLGYDWDPRWYACGESPLCIEVNRLVQSGVAVVVAAGNTGYGAQNTMARVARQGYGLSINDPGNSELAITVGSTHRDQPLVYGVSYFSSKGPTLDGRAKPDLVAPGEYIVAPLSRTAALAASQRQEVDLSPVAEDAALYRQDSGTAMAAAHVSGVAAALLSARRDLIGRPNDVKALLTRTATSLNRDPHFQGAGLVDLLRALFPMPAALPLAGAQAETAVNFPMALPAAPAGVSAASTMVTPAPTEDGAGRQIRLMISYAHEDEKHKTTLKAHLSALSRSGRIDVWQDREIRPGIAFTPEILKQIEQANIIVLLISSDFLASDYCYQKEMTAAIARAKKNDRECRVVPVIVRDVEWTDTPIGGLNALPTDAVAVTLWKDLDAAWRDVAAGIKRVVQELSGEP